MTLAYSTRYKKYRPLVSTNTFLVTFPIFGSGDLAVYVDGVETSLYSVTATYVDGRSDNAEITLNTAVVDVDVEIYGDRPPSSPTSYSGTTPNLAQLLQRDVDRTTAVQQEQARDYGRALKAPADFTGSLTLSTPSANSFIGFDGATNLFTADPSLFGVPVSASSPLASSLGGTGGLIRETVADLLADTVFDYMDGTSAVLVSAGDVIETKNGPAFKVAASSATDHDQATAGGVKLYDLSLRSAATASFFSAMPDGTKFMMGGLAYEVDSAASGAGSATDDLGVDGLIPDWQHPIAPQHFGLASGDAVPAINRMIAYINAAGGPLTSQLPVTASFPAGVYDVRAGGIDAITVSNVLVNMAANAIFLMRDGPVWTVGESGVIAENIWFVGGQPTTSLADSPAADCAWVNCDNGARVFVQPEATKYCPILFRSHTTETVSGVYIGAHRVEGLAAFSYIDIDTSAASVGAGLYLSGLKGFAYGSSFASQNAIPKAITGATQANPVALTIAGHGFTSGQKLRVRDVAGMTELNGNDYTLTVVDANTVTIGVDGTGFTAYSSGGVASLLHWTTAAGVGDTAVVKINGKWDTLIIENSTVQHWPWLYNINATGSVSFIHDVNNICDYMGMGRGKVSNTGTGFSIGDVRTVGGWTYAFDGSTFDFTSLSGVYSTDFSLTDHLVGISGYGIIDNSGGEILDISVDDVRTRGVGRHSSTAILLDVSSGSCPNPVIRGVKSLPSTTFYGSSGGPLLVAGTGIKLGSSQNGVVEGNLIDASVKAYDFGDPSYTTSTGAATFKARRVSGNAKTDGEPPEYMQLRAPAVSTGTWYFRNTLGFPVMLGLTGGTVSAVNMSYVNGSGAEQSPASTYGTTGPWVVAPGAALSIVSTSAPAVRIFAAGA